MKSHIASFPVGVKSQYSDEVCSITLWYSCGVLVKCVRGTKGHTVVWCHLCSCWFRFWGRSFISQYLWSRPGPGPRGKTFVRRNDVINDVIISKVYSLFYFCPYLWRSPTCLPSLSLRQCLSPSPTQTPPNIRPPPTAPTPAAPPAPTPPTAASSLWTAWTWSPEAPPPVHLSEEDEPIKLQTDFKFYLMILLWRGQSELLAAFIFVGFYLLGSPAPWF